MSLKADTRSATRKRSSPWKAVLLVAALALVAGGVVLNESGVDSGRILIFVGLPLALLSLMLFLRRSAEPVAPQPQAPPRRIDHWPPLRDVLLQLDFELGERSAQGEYKGQRVRVSLARGSEELLIRVALPRVLDMGLTALRSDPGGDARRPIVSGDAGFDVAYCVRADEPRRAEAILTPRLRELLLPLQAELEDEAVVLRVPAQPDALADGLSAATRVAAEVARASAKVPCARAMRSTREVWLAFSGDSMLASADTPLAMWGEMHGLQVEALACRDAFENFHFDVTAHFTQPLARGLVVKPASAATALDRSGEPLGMAAFDKLFVVKTHEPADTVRLIDPDTRRDLIAMRDKGLQVRIHDDRVRAWVGLNLNAPLLVPEALRQLAETVARIQRNAGRSKGV